MLSEPFTSQFPVLPTKSQTSTTAPLLPLLTALQPGPFTEIHITAHVHGSTFPEEPSRVHKTDHRLRPQMCST